MAEGTHSSKRIFDLEPLYRQENKLLSGHLPAGVEEHAWTERNTQEKGVEEIKTESKRM